MAGTSTEEDFRANPLGAMDTLVDNGTDAGWSKSEMLLPNRNKLVSSQDMAHDQGWPCIPKGDD